MSTGGLSHPTVLPFSLVSYDGSKPEDEDADPIENVLSADPSLVHCSRDGRNFNLLLQYTPSLATPFASCTLTHVVIHGPTNCTAPVATGIVFASLDQPDVASYTGKYDDITRAQYEALPLSSLQADGAVAFFTLADLDRLQIAVTLPSWVECRYLHLKLLSARSAVDDNIDVARVAAAGFDTAQRPAEETTLPASVPQQLGLMKEELGRWNKLSPDHMRALQEAPACILFGSDPMKPETTAARTLLHGVAMSGEYDGSLTFYHYDDSSSEKEFASAVAEMAGLGSLSAPAAQREEGAESGSLGGGRGDNQTHVKRAPVSIVIAEFESKRRYHYKGPIDDRGLHAWFGEYVAGGLLPYVKTQARPTDDVDASNANVTVVTAGTFDDLVLESASSVLLFVLSAEENELVSAIVRCWLYAAADVFARPELRVASFDADSNDVPAAIPGSAVPGLLLFPSHDKRSVARLSELPTPRSLIRFLQKQLPSLELDLDALLESPRLESAFAYVCLLLDCQQALRNNAGPAEELQWAVSDEERAAMAEADQTVGRALQALIARGPGDEELQSNARAAVQATEAEYAKHQPLLEQIEAAQRLMNEVGGQIRGAVDALSEAEFSALSEDIAYVSFALPRERKAEDSEEAEAVNGTESDSKEASGGAAADAGQKEWEAAKAAPFSSETLRAAMDTLLQRFDVVKDKLAACQAQLAAQADGRVLKCHSAAELSAALAAAEAAQQLTVIDFTAVWCGPCKHAAPVFGQLSVDVPSVQFVKVDVDECEDVRDEYGVEAMPTFVFLRNGSELKEYRIQGANMKALTRAVTLLTKTEQPQTAVE